MKSVLLANKQDPSFTNLRAERGVDMVFRSLPQRCRAGPEPSVEMGACRSVGLKAQKHYRVTIFKQN